MKIEVKSRKEMAEYYSISPATFRKWVNTVPDLHLDLKKRLLTPKQVEQIVTYLGEKK